MNRYTVHRTSSVLDAEPLDIAWFHPRSSPHRPRAQARLAYDDEALHVRFDVADRYVRCIHEGYQQPVCQDSCVEFFVQPADAAGYFNFEINGGGALLVFYITSDRMVLPDSLLDQVRIDHSLPARVHPEITDPIQWSIDLTIPWSFFTTVLGHPVPTTVWRANFYKCADNSSHPHWASWSPVPGPLSFHRPDRFGILDFT